MLYNCLVKESSNGVSMPSVTRRARAPFRPVPSVRHPVTTSGGFRHLTVAYLYQTQARVLKYKDVNSPLAIVSLLRTSVLSFLAHCHISGSVG